MTRRSAMRLLLKDISKLVSRLSIPLIFLLEKYGLVRIDRRGFDWQEQSPYLRAVDILRARQATGLLKRNRISAARRTLGIAFLIHTAAFLTYLLIPKSTCRCWLVLLLIWTKYHANRSCNFNWAHYRKYNPGMLGRRCGWF